MIFSLFKKKSNDQIDINVTTNIEIRYSIPVCSDSKPITVEILRETIEKWMQDHITDESLLKACKHYYTEGIKVYLSEKGPMPEFSEPLDLFGFDQNMRNVYNSCDYMADITLTDVLLFPRLGLLTAYMCAHILAETFHGCVFDFSSKTYSLPRLSGLLPVEHPLLPMDRHIYPIYIEEKGSAQIIGAGMNTFGLPNIEIPNIKPEQRQDATRILLAVCRYMAEYALRAIVDSGGSINKITLPSVIQIGKSDAVEAKGDLLGAFKPQDRNIDVKLKIRLVDNTDQVIVISPPDNFKNMGNWLEYAINGLYGDNHTVIKAAPKKEMAESKKKAADQIVIDLPGEVDVSYWVFIPNRSIPVSTDELKYTIIHWIDQNMSDIDLKETIKPMITRMLLISIREKPRSDIMKEAFTDISFTSDMKSIYNKTDQMIIVLCRDFLMYPRIGLFLADLSAQILAHVYQGCIFDVFGKGWYKSQVYNYQNLHYPGMPVIHHLQCEQKKFLALNYFYVRGLERYGLPNLEIEDLPLDFMDGAFRIAATVAHVLHTKALEYEKDHHKLLRRLKIPSTLQLTRKDAAEATGENLGDNPGYPVDVKLEYDNSMGDEKVLNIIPPDGYKDNITGWYLNVLAGLYGSAEHITKVVSAESPVTQDAHKKAMATFPDAKARYMAGLPPGYTFCVKHGFAIDDKNNYEYMWIIVTSWQGNIIEGVLDNNPKYIKGLHAGDTCRILETQVYDWVIGNDDLTDVSGGYTMKVMM